MRRAPTAPTAAWNRQLVVTKSVVGVAVRVVVARSRKQSQLASRAAQRAVREARATMVEMPSKTEAHPLSHLSLTVYNHNAAGAVPAAFPRQKD